MAERSDYIEVHERLKTFLDKYPNGSLQTEWEWCDRDGERWLVVKAWAYRDPEDPRPGVGHAWEPVPGRTPYTRGSELMVGETSAWGRALAALGIAVHKGIASAAEVRAAEGRKIERTRPAAAADDAWNTPPPAAEAPRRASAKQLHYLKKLCDQNGATTVEQALALVNGIMQAKKIPPVGSFPSMSAAQAKAALDELTNAIPVEQFLEEVRNEQA